ncbi:MAG: serine hydrolase domain-containing protein [Pseudoxanthomonas sp.]
MRTATLRSILLATALFLPALACSRSASHGGDNGIAAGTGDAQASAARFERIMRDHAIPGAQLGHWHRGAYEEFDYGVLRNGAETAVTPRTVFQAASLSKVVGAYIALRFVDAGRLDLDTPLWDYWHSPRTQDNALARRITARMVLNHTTGLQNWQISPSDPALDATPLESLFPPGQRFSYSGEGFYLLQKTLEHIAGVDWSELAQREVFAPLDMPSSRYVTDPAFDALNATGHGKDGSAMRERVFAGANTAWTLTTNAHDYANFVQRALYRGEGLQAVTHAMMLAESSDADDQAVPSAADPFVSWGLGVGIEQTAKRKLVWHWGDNPGFKALFVLDPDSGDSIVLFTNSENGLSTYREVLELFMGPGEYPAVDWASSQS